MSFSKYCEICDTIVTCSFSPSWCPWCGKDLREEQLVEFSGIDGRLNLLNKMRGFPDLPDKIPWDGYYAHKTGRHFLLSKNKKPVEYRQINLFGGGYGCN